MKWLLLLLTVPVFAQVRVRPSVTRNGVYRQQHVRTRPNRTQRDNYSAKGSRNPYTGKVGHKRVRR